MGLCPFIYLVNVGIQSIKPRKVSINKVFLIPVFFVVWSLFGLFERIFLEHPSMIFFWIVFLGFGAYLGVKEVHSWRIEKDRHKREITIPGNYSTLVLVVLIFGLNFFWGYFYATHAQIPYWIYFANTASSALVTGFFVGRAGFYFNRYLAK